MPVPKVYKYTTDYIYSLPEGRRAELINGQIYDMAPPNTMHQRLINRLSQVITNYIDAHNGSCEVFPAPFAVFLNADNKNYVEPDISVICDKEKIDSRGCNGAPDWIIEIISPSTQHIDYGVKLFKYRTAGVREYWIVNPVRHTIQTYTFSYGTDGSEYSEQFSFDDYVPVQIYDGFRISISELLRVSGSMPAD